MLDLRVSGDAVNPRLPHPAAKCATRLSSLELRRWTSKARIPCTPMPCDSKVSEALMLQVSTFQPAPGRSVAPWPHARLGAASNVAVCAWSRLFHLRGREPRNRILVAPICHVPLRATRGSQLSFQPQVEHAAFPSVANVLKAS